MAHGLNSVLRRGPSVCQKATATSPHSQDGGKSSIGSRRIFAPHFKLQVLDSYRNDADCKGNQRATARKYGIHRRQIQKWLQCENNLRNSVVGKAVKGNDYGKCTPPAAALGDAGAGPGRQRGDSAGAEEAAKAAVAGPPAVAIAVQATVACGERDRSSSHQIGLDLAPEPNPKLIMCYEARVPAISPIDVHMIKSEQPWPTTSPPDPLNYTVIHTPPAGYASDDPELGDHSAPMDLSLKRPDVAPKDYYPPSPPYHSVSPLSSFGQPQQAPDIWDLSVKRSKRRSPSPVSEEVKAKPVKLFKPYLDEEEEEEEEEESCDNKKVFPCCNSEYVSPKPIFYNNNNHIITSSYGYAFHEVHPKPVGYFYHVYPECESIPFYESSGLIPPFKQRQSYSLDFKLSAIECYYQDSACRGNQRAVANKYNIHRRQVQKWLKQEEELRQRIETTKHVHSVR